MQLEKMGRSRLGFEEECKDVEKDLIYEGSRRGRDFITAPQFVLGIEEEGDGDVFGDGSLGGDTRAGSKSTPTVTATDMGNNDLRTFLDDGPL